MVRNTVVDFLHSCVQASARPSRLLSELLLHRSPASSPTPPAVPLAAATVGPAAPARTAQPAGRAVVRPKPRLALLQPDAATKSADPRHHTSATPPPFHVPESREQPSAPQALPEDSAQLACDTILAAMRKTGMLTNGDGSVVGLRHRLEAMALHLAGAPTGAPTPPQPTGASARDPPLDPLLFALNNANAPQAASTRAVAGQDHLAYAVPTSISPQHAHLAALAQRLHPLQAAAASTSARVPAGEHAASASGRLDTCAATRPSNNPATVPSAHILGTVASGLPVEAGHARAAASRVHRFQALSELAKIASATAPAAAAPRSSRVIPSAPRPAAAPAQPPSASPAATLASALLEAERQGLLPQPLKAALVEQLCASISGLLPQSPSFSPLPLVHSPVFAVRGGAGGECRGLGGVDASPLGPKQMSTTSAPLANKRTLPGGPAASRPAKAARLSPGELATAAALRVRSGDVAGPTGATTPGSAPSQGTGMRAVPPVSRARTPPRPPQVTGSLQALHAGRAASAPGGSHRTAAPVARGGQDTNGQPVAAPAAAGAPGPSASSDSSDIVIVQGPERPLGTARGARVEAVASAALQPGTPVNSPWQQRVPDPKAMVEAVMAQFELVSAAALEMLQRFGTEEMEVMCCSLRNVMEDAYIQGHTWTTSELELEVVRVYQAHCVKMGRDPNTALARTSSAATADRFVAVGTPPRQPLSAPALAADPQHVDVGVRPSVGASPRLPGAALGEDVADRETMAAAQTLAALGGVVTPAGPGQHLPGAANEEPQTPRMSCGDVDEDAALTQTLEALLEAKSTPVPPRAQGSHPLVRFTVAQHHCRLLCMVVALARLDALW